MLQIKQILMSTYKCIYVTSIGHCKYTLLKKTVRNYSVDKFRKLSGLSPIVTSRMGSYRLQYHIFAIQCSTILVFFILIIAVCLQMYIIKSYEVQIKKMMHMLTITKCLVFILKLMYTYFF